MILPAVPFTKGQSMIQTSDAHSVCSVISDSSAR
jgi:hypothetical protein